MPFDDNSARPKPITYAVSSDALVKREDPRFNHVDEHILKAHIMRARHVQGVVGSTDFYIPRHPPGWATLPYFTDWKFVAVPARLAPFQPQKPVIRASQAERAPWGIIATRLPFTDVELHQFEIVKVDARSERQIVSMFCLKPGQEYHE
jgi:hypothetical protein